jgi:hypothetical protein
MPRRAKEAVMCSTLLLSSPLRLIALLVALALLATLGLPTASWSAQPPKHFVAVLNGAQETPPVPSAGHGNAFLTFDESNKMLCYSIVYGSLLAAEILAHIHGPATAGVPAGVVFPLLAGNPKAGCVGPLDKFQKRDLLKNLLYINIHSAAFPGGELRGQILRIK